MTALLTENLPLLADAPNGIKKLRELILELAVRGKLVPQDPNEEPASELFKRITEQMALLVAAGSTKTQKLLPRITQEETPFDVPAGWCWVRMGAVGETNIGLTYSPSDVGDIGIPVLRSSNVQNGQIDLSDLVRVDVSVKDSALVQEGDLLICARNGSKALVGKTAMISNLKEPMAFGAFMAIFRSTLNPYLLRFINSPLFRKVIDDVNTTTINQITQNNLRTTLLPLPPLAEQHRIVAKVDELMALCNRLEARQAKAESAHSQLVQALLDSLTQAIDAADFAANWQRLAEHLHTLFTTESSIDALKQTLLQLAVMGKLVPQDPSDEPASELLKRIDQEKSRLVAEGKLKKQKSLAELNEEQRPYELPLNWKWVKFDSISNTRLGKMLDKAKNKGELRPYLRNTNVQWFNFELGDLKSMRFEAHELDEYRVNPGDLVICEGGEPGRCAVWQGEIENMLLQKALHRARPWLGVSPFFLQLCLRSSAHSGFMDQFFTGATIKHFSGEKLAKYPVPLPPLAEQYRIVAKVDELIALCDQLKNRLTQARQLNEQLASTLVEQAIA